MAFSSPTAAYTAADLAAMIPEVWSPIVLQPAFNELTILNWATDLSPYMSEGGDIVHVPNIYTNVFSVQTQSTQGNAVVDASPAQVDTTLTVDLHKYIAYIVGDKELVQLASRYSLNEEYAKEIRNLLLEAVETSLFSLYSSLTTNVVGDTTTAISDYEIRTALATVEGLKYRRSDYAIFVHPNVFWKQLAGITKYYTYEQSRLDLIATGGFNTRASNLNYKGTLYDVPVYTSSLVQSALLNYYNLMLHRQTFGYAIQTKGVGRSGMVRIQSDYKLENLGTLVVGDIIYGVAVLRENSGVVLNASDTAQVS